MLQDFEEVEYFPKIEFNVPSQYKYIKHFVIQVSSWSVLELSLHSEDQCINRKIIQ